MGTRCRPRSKYVESASLSSQRGRALENPSGASSSGKFELVDVSELVSNLTELGSGVSELEESSAVAIGTVATADRA